MKKLLKATGLVQWSPYLGASMVSLSLLMTLGLFSSEARAACGANNRQWAFTNGNGDWDQDAKWTGNNYPSDNTENAWILAAQKVPVLNGNYLSQGNGWKVDRFRFSFAGFERRNVSG